MFVLKLVTSLFLASLGFGSNHSPPGVSAVQPAVVPPSSSSAAAAAPQPQSAPGSDSARHNNNAHHHKDMTVKDLRKVFQVHSHADVPEYDVVHLRVISKRSSQDPEDIEHKQVYLNAFGKEMQLNLKPNREFIQRLPSMKMFAAESGADGRLAYVEEKAANSASMGRPYHDDDAMAAVVVRHEKDGRILLDGTIGNDLVIKPVPGSEGSISRDDDEMFLEADDVSVSELNHLSTSSHHRSTLLQQTHPFNLTSQPNTRIPKQRKNMEDAAGKPDSLYHKHAHFVFKKKHHQSEKHQPDFMSLEPGSGLLPLNWTLLPSSNHSNTHRRSKRQSPDTVWPEVLLVVDYDSYLLHGGNSRDVKRYFISFWNGVDLRYKLLSHPRIRVSLAGMIVAKDRDATPYLERNRLRAPNADAVDAAGALTDMGKYLYREDRLPTYDLAVVITKLDMCRRRYEGGRCNRGTAGFAYVGGACVVNKRLEKVNSVAIIEDSGGFSGIIVAAHEVGHLLGCVHDGSPPPSYLGGPGATRCPWEDGFIMSDLRHTERGFRWSSCSVEQFKHFLNGETATCLYNYPHENQLLPRVLPGTMLTLDEQCKRDRGTNACFKDARVCAQLFCFDSASGYCVSYRPAAEGSACGDGQVCRNGKCTAELENIIPDYTHVTQTVVANRPDRLLARSDSMHTSAAPPPFLREDEHNDVAIRDISNDNRSLRPENQRFRSRSFARSLESPESGVNSPPSTSSHRKKSSCRDIIEKMAGSLSCSDFLERFGYRYCNHSYVKRNCCASQAIICNKSTK